MTANEVIIISVYVFLVLRVLESVAGHFGAKLYDFLNKDR